MGLGITALQEGSSCWCNEGYRYCSLVAGMFIFFYTRFISNLITRNMPKSTRSLRALPSMSSLAKHPQSLVNNFSLLANKQPIAVELPLVWNDLRNYKSWSLPGVILPRLKRFTLTRTTLMSIGICLMRTSGQLSLIICPKKLSSIDLVDYHDQCLARSSTTPHAIIYFKLVVNIKFGQKRSRLN